MTERPFDVVDCEQGTEAWFKARVGLVTASRADDMLARTRTGWGAGRKNLRAQLVVERLTGRPVEDGFVTAEMRRGNELEPEARAEVENALGRDCIVTPVGFLRHRELAIGCSPDGIIGDWEGGLELKAPNSATHLEYLKLGGAVPSRYVPQLTHSLYVTGLPFWRFASYDPRFPEPLRLYHACLKAEDANLKEYGEKLAEFLAEMQEEYEEVAAMLAAKVAA